MNENPDESLNGAIAALMTEAGIKDQRALVRRIIQAGIGLGQDAVTRPDLKLTAAVVEEMRAAFKTFAPYRGTPKVTIFGSARTHSEDPLWLMTEATARNFAERGWFVVTGAGPGIMEAAATGAGPEHSLGVSIRLPFEEHANAVVAQDDRLVSMKYFFTRKVMLVKEASGFVCLPGGFGTLDETLELLTLQQTGKMIPTPIVLLDRPGGSYWRGFAQFVTKELAGTGMISIDDLDRVLITDSVDEAIAEITGFWRNYDSLRWVGDRLVLRLRTAPSDADLASLNEHFSGLCLAGRIERTEPLEVERDEPDLLSLPRIIFTPRPRAVGDLHRLIRALNQLG
ncbi:TIGR00730 family Rossman fold protein [Leucobacter insecticola]|uniref:TIGR00730 family Rossman fold protein n=1 Tax=Leucobacter insecticola TaxID=2714934 RepID=A0A6G8FLV5_9MICO|nr:TIGR00730 family Rossman fold protein [Leucobacter insecticola]QIM17470.1 TIGR00730 family Rossman fold protein [Leucobacter insecticola]